MVRRKQSTKRLVVAATSSLLAFDALAASRYDITDMTCAKVQTLVETEGAAILRYGSTRILGLSLYERFVWSQQYCNSGEVVRGAGFPSVDKKYCPVKKCVRSDIFVRTDGGQR